MGKPKIFVSSTYVDLVGLRDSLHDFLQSSGYTPVMFEKGGIYFNHLKPLDESCYKAAKEADIFVLIIGGRYGSPASAHKKKPLYKTYTSVTRMEYMAARNAGIPMFIYVDERVHNDFATWRNNPDSRESVHFAHVDHPGVFELIEEIYGLPRNNLIINYTSVDQIKSHLKDQLAFLVGEQVDAMRKQKREQTSTVPINPYKLFFYRLHQGLSFTALANKSGLDRDFIRRLELLKKGSDPLTVASFPRCTPKQLRALEDALGCNKKLAGAQKNDFLSAYLSFYAIEKGTSTKPRSNQFPNELFPIKAVVFDFDGTLTLRTDDETTWEKIWKSLGYHVNECAKYHSMFMAHKLSHKEWCDITCQKFKEKGLTEAQLISLASSIKLVSGTSNTLKHLHKKRVKLYILSGSIKTVVRQAMGELVHLFQDIKANELIFGADGLIDCIQGTRYDFEGKADFLKQVIEENRLNPLEVLFVGNSCNDVWASESGARTLCVNPRFTNPDNEEHWTHCIRKLDNMDDILQYVGFQPMFSLSG